MKRWFIVLMILFCFILTGCSEISKKEKLVDAVVTQKRYEESFVWVLPVTTGKVTMALPITQPEKFLVTISYDSISAEFDDMSLYETVEEGSLISVILVEYCDENDNIIKQRIELPKQKEPN